MKTVGLQLFGMFPDQRSHANENMRFMCANRGTCNELFLVEEDLDIPWSNLDIKEKIGAGICYYFSCTMYSF